MLRFGERRDISDRRDGSSAKIGHSDKKGNLMKIYRRLVYLLIVLSFTTIIAQDTACNAIVQQALSTVEQGCMATGRNQACYGNVSLEATPRSGVQNFTFRQAGDLVNVADIARMQLSGLNSSIQQWGIALMKLQANLPDTLPGQNITLLLFGDVQIQNAVMAQPTLEVSAISRVNVRSIPSTSGTIVATLSNAPATADGRNVDGSWLRIQIPGSNALGWVFANLVTASGDISALTVVDSTEAAPSLTPMQAFYFSTGIVQTACQHAPQDGILIQTPQGAGQVNFRANDVDVQLGSTAYLQAQPNDRMTISVVEGEGHVTLNGKTVAVPAGTQVTIPMDADLKPSGPLSDALPYDPVLVQDLPVQLLPEQITIALPAVAAATLEVSGAGGGSSGGGEWRRWWGW